MEATEKQINALKRLAKNPELSNGVLKGVSFDELSKSEASNLIKQCLAKRFQENYDDGTFSFKFSQNYRKDDGSFGTAALTDEELAEVREAHKKHCIAILEDCEDDYPDDNELQLAMFSRRADKVFTWIQQALDEKVRRVRGGSNGSQY